MMKTITRADVAETLYQEVGLSRKDSGEILDMVLEEIVNELAAGNDVKLSSFGTFALRDKNRGSAAIPKPAWKRKFLRGGLFRLSRPRQCANRLTRVKHGCQQVKSCFSYNCRSC